MCLFVDVSEFECGLQLRQIAFCVFLLCPAAAHCCSTVTDSHFLDEPAAAPAVRLDDLFEGNLFIKLMS